MITYNLKALELEKRALKRIKQTKVIKKLSADHFEAPRSIAKLPRLKLVRIRLKT